MAIPFISKGVALSAKQSTDQAFGIILRHNFDYMLSWTPIAYKREHIKGVHQVRVTLRRMRSALVIFRQAIPRNITDPWRSEMRWIANTLGPARDMDVFIDEGLAGMAGKIPLASGEKKLKELALKHRDKGYAQMQTMMDGKRYKKFIDSFDLWLKEQGWLQSEMSKSTRKNLHKNIRDYAAKRMSKQMTKFLHAGGRLGRMSEDEEHQLRIECKKFRYAIEFFASLFNEKKMLTFSSHLKELQGLLGIMNDVTVMPGLLKGVLEGVDDDETLQYADALIDWRTHERRSLRWLARLQYADALTDWRARQYEEARNQLGDRWNNLVNTPLPWTNNPRHY